MKIIDYLKKNDPEHLYVHGEDNSPQIEEKHDTNEEFKKKPETESFISDLDLALMQRESKKKRKRKAGKK